MSGHRRGVWSVAFSSVDRVIASASADKTVKIWSLSSYSCIRTFEGHSHSVLKVWFISAGMQVVSGSSDGLLKVWNVRSSECQATLDKHTEKIWAVAVANDGARIISGGADSLVNVWQDETLIEATKAIHSKEYALLQIQKLENSLREKRFRKAIQLSLQLDQPHRTRSILYTILEDENDEHEFARVLSGLSADQQHRIFRYVRYVHTHTHTHSLTLTLSLSLSLSLSAFSLAHS
jgi:U3 small nucleolar RNA-associated protein 13